MNIVCQLKDVQEQTVGSPFSKYCVTSLWATQIVPSSMYLTVIVLVFMVIAVAVTLWQMEIGKTIFSNQWGKKNY